MDGAKRGLPRPFATINSEQLLAAMPEMHALRDRLDTDGVPPAAGVARARELLTDPRSPLYDPNAEHTLRESLHAVLAEFDRL